MIISGIIFIFSCTAVFAVDESDFYMDKIDLVDQTVNLVTDYGANGSDEEDDSPALQNAIDDMTALTNGGKIIIPSGTWHFLNILMKDNVHIVVDTAATIKPSSDSGVIFKFGYDRKGSSAAVTVKNVSIRSNHEGTKYTVDYSHTEPNPNKMFFAACKNVKNFMVADFFIRDNWTKMSVVTTGQANYNDEWWRPENGVIKNGDMSNGHYGYGLIQSQVGKKILFKDLAGTGGITLRLESGAVAFTPDWLNMDSIYARNISSTDGHGGIMMGPHTKDNGHVDADGVYSYGSLYAVGAGGGYVTKEEDSLGYTPGSFASTCVIDNIYASYGENAQLKSKNFDEIPCAIRHLISSEPVMDGKIWGGPASCAVKSTTDEKANPYTVHWGKITMEGFEHQFKKILRLADEIKDCHPVPVTGLSIDQKNLDLVATQTAQLSTTASPPDATDTSVTWTTSDTNIATVDTNGMLTALAEGSAIIIVRARDGGYHDTCRVLVSGAVMVTGVSVEPKADTLEINDTVTLTEAVSPPDATDPSVEWASSDTGVAAVNQDGMVTALSPGKTTITVNTVSGAYSDSCMILVLDSTGTFIPSAEQDNQNIPVRIYPNPVSDVLSLNITTHDNDQIYLKVTDISGRMIIEKNLGRFTPGTHSVEFSKSELKLRPGSYFIVVSDKMNLGHDIVLVR